LAIADFPLDANFETLAQRRYHDLAQNGECPQWVESGR
jgi:hypothetical protein